MILPVRAARTSTSTGRCTTGPTALAPARLRPARARRPARSASTPSRTADVVLVPGLAVSPTGLRLGRGGGCYDRALGRVPVGTFTCVLLYDDEVGLDVPVEPHDRPVTAAATPSGLTSAIGGRGGAQRPSRDLGTAEHRWRRFERRRRLPRPPVGGSARKVSVCSPASSTASGLNGHGSVLPSAHRSVWSV